MATYAVIDDEKIVEVLVPPDGFVFEDCVHESMRGRFNLVPDGTEKGASFVDGVWVAPEIAQISELARAETPQELTVSIPEFWRLWGLAEWVAVEEMAKTSPELDVLIKRLNHARTTEVPLHQYEREIAWIVNNLTLIPDSEKEGRFLQIISGAPV
jgi:hypothetical protein